jgi:hypothetical protein
MKHHQPAPKPITNSAESHCQTTTLSPPSLPAESRNPVPEGSNHSQLTPRQGFPTNTLAENRPQGWPKPTRPGTDRTEKIIMLRPGCKPKAAIFGFHPPSTTRRTPPTGTQYRQDRSDRPHARSEQSRLPAPPARTSRIRRSGSHLHAALATDPKIGRNFGTQRCVPEDHTFEPASHTAGCILAPRNGLVTHLAAQPR